MKKINDHDPEGLAKLMTHDHVFVDSLGRAFHGREEMKKGWAQYFDTFSNYNVSVTEVFARRGTSILLGTATGVHVNRHSKKRTEWKIPAAWKAVVTRGRVSEWHVFADNSETMRLLTTG